VKTAPYIASFARLWHRGRDLDGRCRPQIAKSDGDTTRDLTSLLLTSHKTDGYAPLCIPEVTGMSNSESSILQGTLDLMVLKTLEQLGPLHGYGIALRIEQVGERALIVNQGTVYLCLVRLVQKKWIRAEWGVSDNNRKAKFYSLTKAGRKQLQAETENWERVAGVMGRVLNPQTGN
jgi:transcriptional regulator